MTTALADPECAAESDWNATVADWLAGLFLAPPTTAAVIGYRDGLGAQLLEELEQHAGCQDGVGLMQVALTGPVSAATLSRQLGAGFMQLFEGPGGPRTVSPFESAHFGPRGRLFQAPAAAMDRLLAQTGLTLTSGTGEPSDHVSVELALLARMLRGRADGRTVGSLLDRRLLNWLPGFATSVQGSDTTGFYAGAASLLVGFLHAQRRALGAGGKAVPGPFGPGVQDIEDMV